MSLLPSPPPQAPPTSTFSLPHSSGLPPGQIESLRSSVNQAYAAINELTRMVDMGGDQGIVGWPTLLTSYQNLLSLLGLIDHHLNPSLPRPAASTTVAKAGTGPLPNPLKQILVHPLVPYDVGGEQKELAEVWTTNLLRKPDPSLHAPPPPPPPTGSPADHTLRFSRAARVCELLEDKMMWRGRVGVVDPSAPDAVPSSESESESEDDDEDMFGSADEEEEDAMDGGGRKKKGKGKEEVQVMEKGWTKEERERELKEVVGFVMLGKMGEREGMIQ